MTTATTTQGLPWACAHASVKLSAPTSCRSIFDALVLEATTSLTDKPYSFPQLLVCYHVQEVQGSIPAHE